MRVGLMCHRGVGGSARVAVDLGNALAHRGHDVHLFARTLPLGLSTFAPGVTFHPLREGDGHAPASARLDEDWSEPDVHRLADRVGAVVHSPGLDILHFHYAVPFAWVTQEVRRRLGREMPPSIGTLHGTDVSVHGRSSRRPSLARALAETSRLTTVSTSHVRLATQAFELDRPPELIPNFVDVRRFRPANGNGSSAPRPARIVHVSNFRPVKDPAAVVRVFARVIQEIEAELWLVGDGEAMADTRSAIRQAGVGPHVRFLGLHPSVELVLPHADVLLLTSRAESFCLAALEAAACGVPAVGPRVGGLPEVVAHDETGLLYEAGDERAAAKAVLRILRHEPTRTRLRAGAVRRSRRFSSEAMVPRYEGLYRRVLDPTGA